MKLHEYQAKELLAQRGVVTLLSKVCHTTDEARQAIDAIGLPCVIKAQVHAGGRGKVGGVKVAKTKEDAITHAQNILGMTIKTAQTGEAGQKVSCILIEQGVTIKKELYVAFLIDRASSDIVLIASKEGGMDIEEVSAKHPESIRRIHINKGIGLMPYQTRQLALELQLPNTVKNAFTSTMMGLFRTFIETDGSMLEINPLIIDDQDRIIALDAKMIIDDNALFRQKAIGLMRDPTQEDEKEVTAQEHGLSYVALNGTIGCMVNGAGLAMATMDIIKFAGGLPANFLDVGGSATQERVEEALRIIVKDTNVKTILVNVFGGIAKCDIIAQGVVNASRALKLQKPLVVRLQGTNVALGKDILDKSGLRIISADTMLDAAEKAVRAANQQ